VLGYGHNVPACYYNADRVPPATHSVRDALARPVLLPLSPKAGVLSQARFQTFPFGCGANQADAGPHDRHPNSRRRHPCSCSADCVTKLCRARRCRSSGRSLTIEDEADDTAAAGAKESPGSARGSAEDNDEDVDEKEDDGPGPDNPKVPFNLVSYEI
jgi:hypothetical protein